MSLSSDKKSNWSDLSAESIFAARRAQIKGGDNVEAPGNGSHPKVFTEEFASRVFAARKSQHRIQTKEFRRSAP